MTSRVIIAGSRDYDNYKIFSAIVNMIFNDSYTVNDRVEIVSGGCSGPDIMGERYAHENDIECVTFPAEWKKYGRSAGIKRNNQMIQYASNSNIPTLIAFWNGKSKGTKHTIDQAKENNFRVFVVNCDRSDDYVRCFDKFFVEGVSYKDNDFLFNFYEDNDDDIIKLTIDKINMTTRHGNVYYYGYKANLDKNISDERRKFFKYAKDNVSSEGVQEIVYRSIEHFADKVNLNSFDCILVAPSKSGLANLISEFIEKKNHIPIVALKKCTIDDIHYDETKIDHLSNDIIEKLNKELDYAKQKSKESGDSFQLKYLRPICRKILAPTIKFDDESNVTLDNVNNILIIDDIVTSGKTMDDIVSILTNNNYQGDITLFSLIKNF